VSAPALAPRFEPGPIEARWQAEWERLQAFRAPDRPDGPTFSLILPPPNVTGVLTLGHMLGDTVMDIFARRHRMRGHATLWVPGVDHAGLATQVEVRRRMARQGVRFEELPREQALGEVERWKAEHEARIREQMRAGGFSVDWSRFRYTMDPESVRATREVFVALWRAGLVYRGERMVNWDPQLRTAISDLEVVRAEEDVEFLYVLYRWADGAPGGLEVATVRPETFFGDVAVAVHPDDARHREAVGRAVVVPLVGRTVPVIRDAGVDPEFGTGALKVTPRHDHLDREIAQRHPDLLEAVEIFDETARLTGPWVPPALHGLDRTKARQRTIEMLEAEGTLLRRVKKRTAVARSERSEAVVEPRLSTQWFVRMGPLAAPVIEAVRREEIRLRPPRWERTFFRWMEGIEDWCISRQVLWGVPVPVVYCRACGHATATAEPIAACPDCHRHDLQSDPDVLDTWFTSWLWPFSSLGWPEKTSALEHYYPTNVLVTGRDIMFFWVARMMMAGFRFTGNRPFSEVYFTGMLRDEHGRRMSKHLGNSPDPLALVRERGADALRFALVFPNPTDEDGPFGTASLDGGRNFLTKLWNLVRFALLQLPAGTPAPSGPPARTPDRSLEDRWVLERYRRCLVEVDEALDEPSPTRAAGALHTFLWHDVADRYVEIAKDALGGRRGEVAQREARDTLLFVLERSVRLLHPFVPHVTEELWHALPHDGELLALARWPTVAEVAPDPGAVEEMEPVLEAIRLFRNARAEEKVPAAATPRAWIRPTDGRVSRTLLAQRAVIVRQAQLGALEIGSDAPPTETATASRVSAIGECYLERPADAGGGADALEREKAKLVALLAKARERLDDPGFAARAPPRVVEEHRARAQELEERIAKIDEHLRGGTKL
jgi:valyl-tRNA synthetase